MSKYTPIVIPRNKKYGNNYWNSDGLKVGMREVTLYSDLEFDHFVDLETDPYVKTYCEQPKEISFVVNGELHTSIFDAWIQFMDDKEKFREVKYSVELNPKDPRNYRTLRQIEAQRNWCNENGFEYEVITEETLRKNHLALENKIKILSFVKNNPKPKHTEEVEQALANAKVIKLEDLEGKLELPYSLIFNASLWLLYSGKIKANLEKVILGKQTEVWT